MRGATQAAPRPPMRTQCHCKQIRKSFPLPYFRFINLIHAVPSGPRDTGRRFAHIASSAVVVGERSPLAGYLHGATVTDEINAPLHLPSTNSHAGNAGRFLGADP